MLFNSASFAYFFVVVTTLYFLLKGAWRIRLLLAASCVFYMAFVPAYILILFVLIGIDYVAGLFIEGAEGKRRKAWLILSLLANVSLLGVFKYYNFANANLTAVLGHLGVANPMPALKMVLPIGLSFHTFQSMSYTIEVYFGRQRAERSLTTYALYVLFFPQLVAGPIERPQNILPQLHADHRFDFERLFAGLRLMAWGLFKKMAIADLVAGPVSTVYAAPSRYSGPLLLLATFFFTVQIYCDFSGYSDVARGIARILGIELMVNFRQPYFSKSISEFWRRWHISLSTWFRDYVFIPLGGSRGSRARNIRNLVAVFAISGLWHGAAWTFIVWGLVHGFYLTMSIITEPLRASLGRTLGLSRVPVVSSLLSRAFVFVLALLAWVLFRAASMRDAIAIYAGMFRWSGFRSSDLWTLGLPRFEMMVAFALCAVLFGVDAVLSGELGAARAMWERRPVRWAAYAAMVYGIVFFGVLKRLEFIYFQF